MGKLLFGPAGNSNKFYDDGYKSSVQAPAWIKSMGLDAYEYQLTRGVRIGDKTAKDIGKAIMENGISMSVHAPYYINLATQDKVLAQKTKGHFARTFYAARLMNAKTVVFHPGSARENRTEALERAKELFHEVLKMRKEEGLQDITLAPENAGKKNQLGTLDEIFALCKLGDEVIPTIDFAHLHAVTGGGMDSRGAFAGVLDAVFGSLPNLRRIHIHFSPIEYTTGGEKKHRTTLDKEYGPDFVHLAALLAERGIAGTVICESDGRQAEDALIYKAMYKGFKAGTVWQV